MVYDPFFLSDGPQCGHVAPWKDENDEDVLCNSIPGHSGRHGGNGWTWEETSLTTGENDATI